MPFSPLDFVRRMLDECRFVTDRVAGISRANFSADETLKRALVRSLEIIGEAAARVPDDIRSRLSGIDWQSVASLREGPDNGYFEVDDDVVWDTVSDTLPELRRVLEQHLSPPREHDIVYDAVLAERVRKLLQRRKGITESRMFGGVAYLLNGHMCCGVREEFLILHLGEPGAARAVDEEEHVHEVDFTSKPFKSMVCVSVGGYRSDQDLRTWVTRAAAYVKKLPPK